LSGIHFIDLHAMSNTSASGVTTLAGGGAISDLEFIGGEFALNTAAFYFGANVTNVTIADAMIGAVGGMTTNTSGGITVSVASDDYFNIHDNQFVSQAVPISYSGGAHSIIHDNAGYNPVGTTAAASTGTTGSTITAGPMPETHYVKQSATFNAAVTKNSLAICTVASANVPCVIELGPNESYVVTWTTTQPTYTKDVH
jgi:hypothetical protein